MIVIIYRYKLTYSINPQKTYTTSNLNSIHSGQGAPLIPKLWPEYIDCNSSGKPSWQPFHASNKAFRRSKRSSSSSLSCLFFVFFEKIVFCYIGSYFKSRGGWLFVSFVCFSWFRLGFERTWFKEKRRKCHAVSEIQDNNPKNTILPLGMFFGWNLRNFNCVMYFSRQLHPWSSTLTCFSPEKWGLEKYVPFGMVTFKSLYGSYIYISK